MKTRFRALVVMALLLLSILAFAGSASASPKTGPDVPDCSIWTTVANTSNTVYAGSSSAGVYLQRLTPGSCPEFRTVTNFHNGSPLLVTDMYVSVYWGGVWHDYYVGSASCPYTDCGVASNTFSASGLLPNYMRAKGDVYSSGYGNYYGTSYSTAPYES